MGRPYGDDLRRKFLSAYDESGDTLEELAERFVVSLGWAKKISAQRNRTGQAERVPHQPGRKPHAGAEAQKQILDWIGAKPDMTLAEIRDQLRSQATVRLSIPQIWRLLRKMGLRLKKSRSTPLNATPKPTVSNEPNSLRGYARSRRSG
jgi:transposase